MKQKKFVNQFSSLEKVSQLKKDSHLLLKDLQKVKKKMEPKLKSELNAIWLLLKNFSAHSDSQKSKIELYQSLKNLKKIAMETEISIKKALRPQKKRTTRKAPIKKKTQSKK